jgi:mannosyltransferase
MRGTPSDAPASRPGESQARPPSAGRATASPAAAGEGPAGSRPVRTGQRRPRSRAVPWLVIVIPMLAELAVGGYRISGPSLWRDEAATISGSQRPVGDLLTMIAHQDAVHGFYYLVMHPVIAAWGISATTLRLPSLIAMCLTAGLTAALGRRLAAASGIPGAELAGLLAGLALVAVPLTTRYAQEARPYALTSLFAVLASYLLVRAVSRPGWSSWLLYGLALLLTGLFSLFAVLLAVAHGVSLWWARPRAAGEPGPQPAGGQPTGRDPASAPSAGTDGAITTAVIRRWLAVCVAAAVLLGPVAYLSAGQTAQLSWVTKPTASTVASLLRDFSGATVLMPVIAALALLGCAAGVNLRRSVGLNLANVALPWLVLPPVILLAVSFAKPVYVERYVLFGLPALTLLTAAGLVWLTVLARRALAGRGLARRPADLLAAAPAALLVIAMIAVLAGPQRAIRQPGSRPDNLRAVAAVISRNERPGDAIVYLPQDAELVGVAYPAPFSRLRDIGLGKTPDASGTLRGLPAAPAVVATRLRSAPRVWTVQWAHALGAATAVPARLAKLLTSLRLIRTWRVQSVVLRLYAARTG